MSLDDIRTHGSSLAASVFLFALIASSGARAGYNVLRFEHLSIDDGLSESAVTRVIQDRSGFLWFGTQDGLNRYDGHNLHVFRNDPADTNSLSDSYITALLEDNRGNIWVGTNSGGLDRFNPQSQTFSHFGAALRREESPGIRAVTSIVEDFAHYLWIGRVGRGVSRIDPLRSSFRSYMHHAADSRSLSDDKVWALYVDHAGSLWVATYDGMNRYNAAQDDFETYNVSVSGSGRPGCTFTAIGESPDGSLLCAQWGVGIWRFDRLQNRFVPWQLPVPADNSGAERMVWCFAVDRSQDLWIGTHSAGLLRVHRGSTQRFVHESDDANSLSANQVVSLFVDVGGSLWIGTVGGGVNRYSAGYRGFAHYRHSASDTNTIAANQIWSFLEDRSGDVWIGTMGGGVDRIEKTSGRVLHYPVGLPGGKGLTSTMIVALCEDRDGSIWLGTKDAGVFHFIRNSGQWVHYQSIRNDSTTIGSNAVNSVYLDGSGTLWAGTFYGGLSRFDRNTGHFTRFVNNPADPGTLADNTVFPILESRRGGLWVGMLGGGLDKFQNGRFIHYRCDSSDSRSLSNDGILSLFEDHAGVLWIGTMGGGLDRFDEGTGTFTHFTEKEGLPNSTIYGILEDDHGNLWLSTNKGIARFDVRQGVVCSYTVNDGLQSNEFNAGAYLRLHTGEMLFGGLNGFNRFHPDSVRDNRVKPPVVLTAFSVLGSRERFQSELSTLSEIRLSYAQNFFSCEFAALDYANPGRNQYAYMLEGFDKAWVRSGNGHIATYTNVDPGHYTFRVAAANNDGIWNWEGPAINIVVVPPVWATWWAKVLYVLTVAGGAIGFVRIRSLSHARAMHEKEMKIHEKEMHEQQISNSLREKEVLLKEIHHRVKNNMQVITSLLNLQAYQTEDPSIRALFRETQDRVRSMALVHEKLYRSEDMASIDFGEYLKSLTTQLMRSNYRPGITATVDADRVLLEINIAIPCGLIVNELVSNALKHAFEGREQGTVVVTLKRRTGETVELRVQDDGVGFPPGVDIQTLTSMGMNIINTLTSQIFGTVTMERAQGTAFLITFPG